MQKFVFFAVPFVATIPIAVLLCHIRTARGLRVSYGTVLFSAVVVTLVWLGFTTQGEIYTIRFWDGTSPKPAPQPLMLKIVAFTMITCIFPALFVVHGYQRDRERQL